MRKILFFLPLFFMLQVGNAESFKNLDFIKTDLIFYHDSGQYQREQMEKMNEALQYLNARIANKKNPQKLAVVLDIDETSLSNYRDMLAMNFGGTDKQIEEAEGKGTDAAIQPTLQLYQFAKANHVAIFFITGRRERYRQATERNLRQVGFKQWDGLTLKPNNYNLASAAIYKTHIRKKITEQGYDIILNVGDQDSDLIGGYSDKTIKLPNPYYFIR